MTSYPTTEADATFVARRIDELREQVTEWRKGGGIENGDADVPPADLRRAIAEADRLIEEAPGDVSTSELSNSITLAQRALSDPVEDVGDEKHTQAQTVLALAGRAVLFRTPDGERFARFPVHAHDQCWPIRSREFKLWLGMRFAERTGGKPAQSTAISQAIDLLDARAQFEGYERSVHTRVAERNGRVYVDVGDSEWGAIEITQSGWGYVPHPPVYFRRARGQLALPMPEENGSLDALREFVNIRDERDFRMIVAWLISALMPTGPYPLLVIHGEQGSAKSTTTRYLRQLVDPNGVPTRDAPKEPRDLAVSARNARVLAFDNLSHLPEWLSDAFCRLATGGGFATRKLYTDDEEAVFYDQRPIVLNGIEELATRGDLLDRAIVIDAPTITDAGRKTESELDEAFERSRPALLGALLDAVVVSLRRKDDVQLEGRPRMADFAVRTEAAAPALGWKPGEFLRLYAANRHDATLVEIEASIIGAPLLIIVDKIAHTGGEWTGQTAELLATLALQATDEERRDKRWPKSPQGLTAILKRLAPALRKRGVNVERGRAVNRARSRTVTLRVADELGSTEERVRPQGASSSAEKSLHPARSADKADELDELRPSSSVEEQEEGEGIGGCGEVGESSSSTSSSSERSAVA